MLNVVQHLNEHREFKRTISQIDKNLSLTMAIHCSILFKFIRSEDLDFMQGKLAVFGFRLKK